MYLKTVVLPFASHVVKIRAPSHGLCATSSSQLFSFSQPVSSTGFPNFLETSPQFGQVIIITTTVTFQNYPN